MGAYVAGPAAAKITADVAGNTSHAPVIPTAMPVTFSEILNGIGTEYGGLHNLFGGSTVPVDTNVTIATDSTVGRLGGLVPAIHSVVAAGPALTPDSSKTGPVNDSVNDPGITQQTQPGQVARNVANVPGGYANVAGGALAGIGSSIMTTLRGFLAQ